MYINPLTLQMIINKRYRCFVLQEQGTIRARTQAGDNTSLPCHGRQLQVVGL